MTRKVNTPEGQSKMVSLVKKGRAGYATTIGCRNHSARV